MVECIGLDRYGFTVTFFCEMVFMFVPDMRPVVVWAVAV